MSYPIITNNFESNLISFDSKEFISKNGTKIITHNIKYEYDNKEINKLCILTSFVKITKLFTHNFKPSFQIKICDNEQENMIINIVSKISDMMMAKYNIKHKIYPICTNNEFICIFETYGKNITCPIFYHRSKKQGEQIIKINNTNILEQINEIKKEMILFKYQNYNKHHKNILDKDIHYQGRFGLNFIVKIIKLNKEDNEHDYYHCKIYIVIKECEIKHNVSNVKSLFDKDIIIKNKDIKVLFI